MARLTDEQQLTRLEETEGKLKARKKAVQARLRSKERKADARRKIIIGAIALEHTKYDKEWGDWLWQILNNEVKRPADRELLGLPPLK
ncbi:hypothetical protein [Ahrensia marina]|uniref:Mobilization protein n=1 Tax=Ahrensia marina TaxID=1514904 RepID=A0A0N0VL64_9HYPH|nr:hypothetical protein [Ahrensia marina]KPA99933.1 hypothetical protein SU32_16525 [Ahrensia marina]